MSEITTSYLSDANVHRWTTTAKAAQISGSGSQGGYAWVVTTFPDEMIDSDNPDAEASGAPTLRASLDEGGSNQLNLYIQDFTPASGGHGGGATARVWLNPGTHTGGTNLPVTFYWITGGSQTQPARGDTYGSDGVFTSYAAFWPFIEDPSGSAPQMKDKSANANDGTSTGTMTSGDQIDLVLSSGIDFDGSNDAITVSDDDSLSFNSGTGMTIGFWFNMSAQTGFRTFLSKRNNDEAVDAEYYVNRNGTGATINLGFYDGGYLELSVSYSTGGFANGNLDFFTGTIDQNGTDVDLEMYRDGGSVGSTTHATQTVTQNAAPVTIGATKYTTASIDEENLTKMAFPFIYHGILTADQIATMYNNQVDPATFWDTTAAVSDGPFGAGSSCRSLSLGIRLGL